MLKTLEHEDVREIQLDRPPVNALDPALIQALRQALANARREGVSGLVLSGAPARFSGGLDVPAMLKLSRDELRDTWSDFFALLSELAHLPMPWAAALTGHSPAGGTVLALYADHRIMAEGKYVIGLNEVQVGLAVPAFLYQALTHVVGSREAHRMAMTGILIDPAEALRVHLVDHLATGEQVIPQAVTWVQEILRKPRKAMLQTRALARRPLHESFQLVNTALVSEIVDEWFSEETQATLNKLAARLGKVPAA
jgi:enoyl-CoA hydratase/carnithine racemase